MEGLLDRASPRRGSLTSLHRYSSGSFSHNPKLGSPSNTLQINSGNFYALCKDLDKFTRYFIVKAVQVIVQSRIGDGHKLKADCKPNGNDWFNINIADIVEVSDKTKAVLDAEGLSVKSNWRVCCEISVKTTDGSRVVLEHWIISNKSYLNSNQKLNNSGQSSPKSFMANRSLNAHLTSSNGGANVPQTNSSGRDRTYSNSSRTRLNSIDDYSSENNYTPSGRQAAVTIANNENIDMKPSTSCYSLSSAPNTNIHPESNNLIIASPSTKSLNSPAAASATGSTHEHPSATSTTPAGNPSASQHQNQSHQTSTATATAAASATSSGSGSKTSATSSIYTIYNRMSLLLKTLLTTAHVVPAYRLASRTSRTDSCVICYRVYMAPRQAAPASRGSIEDINSNLHHSESPNKRSLASTASLNSVDIREFVETEELEHFCPILKLGTIKTDVSEMEVSVCYRTDIRNSSYMLRNPKPTTRDKYNRILDEDCLTAAKQLLAGNDVCLRDTGSSSSLNNQQEYRFKNGSQNSLNSENRYDRRALDFLDQPLKPAFATSEVPGRGGGDGGGGGEPEMGANRNINGCELIESAFDGLLRKRCLPSDDDLINIASDAMGKPSPTNHDGSSSPATRTTANNTANGKTNGNGKSANAQSEPIQVPNQRGVRSHGSNQPTPGSTPKSLTDSYVFVELNPPFASEEQNDINSFFHGPSPSFSNGSSNLRDVDELTSQLATIEANASQIDDFVDNMCASEDDEQDED